jgi:hypothetical protein
MNYYWVGGYTGYTGTNSGYSGGLWYRPGGATGGITAGDLYFGPYSWNVLENWRIPTYQDPISGNYIYEYPSQLPQGGDDSVFFGKIYTGVSGASSGSFLLNPHMYSCLYGGMSGDGFTASSATGWAGNNGAARYQPIDITIDASFIPGSVSGLVLTDLGRIGSIGITSDNPLRVYPGFTRIFEKPSETVGANISLRSMHTSKSVIQSYSSDNRLSAKLAVMSDYSPDLPVIAAGRKLKVDVKGGWQTVYQTGGTLILGQMFTTNLPQYSDSFGITWANQGANVLVEGKIRKFLATEESNVHYYMITPTSVIEGVEIKGRSTYPLSLTHGPSTSIIRTTGWAGMSVPVESLSSTGGSGGNVGTRPSNGIILGKLPTNSSLTGALPFYIEDIHLDNAIGSGALQGTHAPNVWFANTEIKEFKGIAGRAVLMTNEPNNTLNRVRIKNGFLMNGFTLETSDVYNTPQDGLVSLVVGITNTSGFSGAYAAGLTANIGITTISGPIYGLRNDNLSPYGTSVVPPISMIMYPPKFEESSGITTYIRTWNTTSLERPSSDPT